MFFKQHLLKITPMTGLAIFGLTLAIIFSIELAIMGVFYLLDFTGASTILLDSFLLSVLCTPFLYRLIVRPLHMAYREAKHAETIQELAVTEWQNTFDAITDFISIHDAECRIIKANKSFNRVFKLREADFGKKFCYEILHKTAGPLGECALKQVFATGQEVTQEVFEPTLNMFLQITMSPIKDAHHKITGVVHVAKDITKQKKAAEDIAAAAKIKSDFTSMVSHELRTPLVPIKESINLALEGVTGPVNDQLRDLLIMAKRNVDRLARLVNDMLDFQKLDSGRMAFHFQENDMTGVVEEVYKTMVVIAREKGLDFKVEVEPHLPASYFDRDKIVQVLSNLVNNALKFTEKGGIGVEARLEKGHIHVTVMDSGPGIKPEEISLLFKSFQQLGSQEGYKHHGSGLGLAISKEIIAHHQGQIWVESVLGQGSQFHFLLPVRGGSVKVI